MIPPSGTQAFFFLFLLVVHGGLEAGQLLLGQAVQLATKLFAQHLHKLSTVLKFTTVIREGAGIYV